MIFFSYHMSKLEISTLQDFKMFQVGKFIFKNHFFQKIAQIKVWRINYTKNNTIELPKQLSKSVVKTWLTTFVISL